MRTLIKTAGLVSHMAIDLRNSSRLLFADSNALKYTDGTSQTILVGSVTDKGYLEGIGSAARFSDITGFVQVNASVMYVVDRGNHCLREVVRGTLNTSRVAGKCQTSGFQDGLDARFYYPKSAVVLAWNNLTRLLVADEMNNALRQVEIATRITTTIIRSNLTHPIGVAFGFTQKNLLISNSNYISGYDLTSRNLVNITGSAKFGFKDGKLNESLFDEPFEMISLSDDVTLVIDQFNNRLRVINTAVDSVTSICTGMWADIDGSPQTCAIIHPFSLLQTEKLIYVGEIAAIRTLAYEIQKNL